MNNENNSRRDFVRKAGVAAAVGWTVVKSQSVYGTPANSKVKIGLLGCGRRGTNVSRHFVRSENAEVTALADIYEDQIERAREVLPAPDAQAYKSAEAILDADIDAIYIATPPYVHPEQFEMAVESGKHIFMEKPVAVDPAGIRRVIEAGRKVKPDRAVIIGLQQRWGKDYNRVYRRVVSGDIGEIRMVRTAWLSSDLPRRSGHPDSQEKVRNWLFYKERSGDIIVEQHVHNLDVVHWFTRQLPVSAIGYGARAVRTDIGDIMDTLAVTYKLPGGLVWEHSGNQISKGGYRDVGEYFWGTKGVATTSRRGYSLHFEDGGTLTKETGYNINEDLVNAFIQQVQGVAPAENAAIFAAESTLVAIMGRIAIEQGREVTWDEVYNM